jgi:anti-sigma regulatory factor (Ser/Thr protein kinase)
MAGRVRIEFDNNRMGVERLVEEFTRFARGRRVPARIRREMHLALDEVISNIIRHGYRDEELHRIAVELAVEGGVLQVEVFDDAASFNPAAARRAPRPGASPGGWGLRLVQQLTDGVEYRRNGGTNHLVLKWKIARG